MVKKETVGPARHYGKVQRHSFLDLPLLAPSDVGDDGLGCTLHRFRRHLQASQNFHLLPALIEGVILAHQGLHAANPRREFRILDVQFRIGGALASVTVRTPIVGTGDLRRAQGGQHGFGTQRVVVGSLAARTSHGALFVDRRGELEQLAQGGGAGAVQGGTHGHLRGLQIEAPGLAPILENHPQELVYFPRDLLPDRFPRFFSWSVSDSSSQMAVLVSTNSRLKSWNLRNSATSRSALWMAAGVGKIRRWFCHSSYR